MNKEEIYVRKKVTEAYPQLKKNIKKVCGAGYDQWGDDLLAVSIEFFLEKPLVQQLKTIEEGKLENFITWIANIQLKSNSSRYYLHYRRPMLASRELFEINYDFSIKSFNEELMQCVEKVLEGLDPVIADAIVQIAYYNKPLYEISEELGVCIRTTKTMLDKAVKQIQKQCQECI